MTKYAQVWNALRWCTSTLGGNDYYGVSYLRNVVRSTHGSCTRHIGRYLNQLVANGMAMKPKTGERFYRAKAKYKNTVNPLPRVKVKSELKRNAK